MLLKNLPFSLAGQECSLLCTKHGYFLDKKQKNKCIVRIFLRYSIHFLQINARRIGRRQAHYYLSDIKEVTQVKTRTQMEKKQGTEKKTESAAERRKLPKT